MGKKDKASKKGGENEDVKRGQKLQAILMAVSFTKYFRPISYIKPKVMLPLVNVPMITYTIEFLAQNGVEEVLYICYYSRKFLIIWADIRILRAARRSHPEFHQRIETPH